MSQDEFVSFGDVCRSRLQMQCQYGSSYVDPGEFRRGGAYLGRGLRIMGLGSNGEVNNYHDLRIHRDDVDEFVRRVAAYKVHVGAWMADDSRVPSMSSAETSYRCGESAACLWIAGGGSLDADGPDTTDEAFFNGFVDTLAKAKREKAPTA